MSVVMALDISSTATGICIFSKGKILYNEVLKLKQKSHAERLLVFEIAIKSIIGEYSPTDIAIEDCWQGSNRKTFKILALYHGVAYKLTYEYLKKDPFVMMPSEIRKLIGNLAGRNLLPSRAEKRAGADSKELTFDLIKEVFKLSDYIFTSHNDQTDAIAVALAFNLVNGDEYTRSILNIGNPSGVKRRGGKKSLPKASTAVSPRQKPRKPRSRRKV